MSRGRGARGGFTVQRAGSPSRLPAAVWLERLMAEIEPLVDADCLDEARRLMELRPPVLSEASDLANDFMDPWDPEAPARRLIVAASWALACPDPDGLAFARRIIDAARQRTETLLEDLSGLGWGDRHAFDELLARSAMSADDPKSLRKQLLQRRAIVEKLETILRRLGDAVSEAQGDRIDWLGVAAQGQGPTSTAAMCRSIAFQARTVSALHTCIADQELERTRMLLAVIARHASYGQTAIREIEDITADDLHLISVATRNPETFAFARKRFLHELVGNRDAMLQELRDFRARRLPGELTSGRPRPDAAGGGTGKELSAAKSAEDARAQMRGLLRSPTRFASSGLDPRNSGVRGTVSVSPEALRDLIAADPDLDCEVVVVRSDRGGEGTAYRPGYPAPGEGERLLMAMAHRYALVDGVRVELRYVSPLEVVSGGDGADWEQRKRWRDRGRANPLWPQDREPSLGASEEDDLRSLTAWETPDQVYRSRVAGLDDLLGPDRCDHPGATWGLSRTFSSNQTDTAALSCPRCLRRRAAVVPLHRMPQEFVEAQKDFDPDEYVLLERVHSAFHNDQRPVESYEQLRARDGVVSMDPADHAVMMDAARKPARTSVAAAMNRR